MKSIICQVLGSVERRSYHQKVIEEKDLSLVHSCPLRPVGVGDFIELAATYQPTVGKGQHLFVVPETVQIDE